MGNGNKPETKFRAGSVTATIWKNTGKFNGKETEYSTVSLTRSYKKDDEWKSANSMRVQDLPHAALVLNKAFEFLCLREQVSQSAGNDDIEISVEDVE